MVTILYHARTNGYVCKRIAQVNPTVIEAICDKNELPTTHLHATLVRWDSKAELKADRTINSADSVRLSRNKRKSRLELDCAGLGPETWTHRADVVFPAVVRPKRHFGGHDFYLCENKEDLNVAIGKCGIGRWYASEFIEKISEYRVFVLNGETFKVIRRYRDDVDPKVPWNFHNGGKSIRVKKESWPKDVVKIAEKGLKTLGLQLAAIDVIMDKEGKPYVLEANTAPGLDRQKTIELFAKKLGELG